MKCAGDETLMTMTRTKKQMIQINHENNNKDTNVCMKAV